MFDSLIGNAAVATFIEKLLIRGRFPNSAIFAGPDGVGKKGFALETARAIVCSSAAGACGTCPSCLRVGRFNVPKPDKKDPFKNLFFSEHPDVAMVVPFNRNVLVDAIRHLEAEAFFRPFEAAGRVFIIDEADKMNDAAANALLKTLEEPAATSYIILVTSRPDSLLPTIRSRSQIIRFTGVAPTDIESHLMRNENWGAEDSALAARVCAGSVARAMSMNIETFRAARTAMLELVEHLSRHSIGRLLQSAERMNDAKNKDDFESNLAVLESLVRDAWLLKQGGADVDIANCDVAKQLSSITANLKRSSLAEWLTAIETMRENLSVNINRKIATDALFLSMSA